ncbi:MAG: Na(+)-translocating NADH-quinone reductase subunit F [Syntrophus sp. SKADARSKE-3]|nr:Na(+)-translocating NADH-quinone reductase subunit F [Syntrophus sp. SKADARSKE-3]
MPTITFQPDNITITVEPGTELLDAARRAGADVEAPCGGKGTCGNCAVRIRSGRAVTEDRGLLNRDAVDEGFVLACRTVVGEDDLNVFVPEDAGSLKGVFVDENEITAADPIPLPPGDVLLPPVKKICLHVPPSRRADGRSDLDRLAESLTGQLGHRSIHYNMSVLRHLAETLRTLDGVVTVTVTTETHSGGEFSVFAIDGGDTTGCIYGIAVDIGTTTVAVRLVDLGTGKVMATAADYNGQLACGLDIISRIDYARRPDRREELRRRVVRTINRLIHRVTAHTGLLANDVACVAVSGNTTMIHLFLGINPEYIRLDPFTPTLLSVPPLTAADAGLLIMGGAPVLCSPAVGSYIGGDITAGLLCTDLIEGSDKISLFMDIGTNGEVVLGNGEFLLAAACSAGPAFEGGGIKWGMRAAGGAVEKVVVDSVTGLATVWTIGQAAPRGVCGSGMISLLAELLKTGWIDAAGKFNRDRPSPAIRINGRKASYTLVQATESAAGKEIVIDEQDVENIIRAKASLYAACALLLSHAGITFEDIAAVYVAGGFGRYLDLDDACAIGLLPNLPHNRFLFAGNTSLRGSCLALVSGQYRRKLCEVARRMTYLELTTTSAYMDQYTAALFLPHTDPASFNSIP